MQIKKQRGNALYSNNFNYKNKTKRLKSEDFSAAKSIQPVISFFMYKVNNQGLDATVE